MVKQRVLRSRRRGPGFLRSFPPARGRLKENELWAVQSVTAPIRAICRVASILVQENTCYARLGRTTRISWHDADRDRKGSGNRIMHPHAAT